MTGKLSIKVLWLIAMLVLTTSAFAQRVAVLNFNAGSGVTQMEVDGLSSISKIKSKLDDVKSRKLIRKYGFIERLNMSEDDILEVYSYEDLKKIKTAIDRGERIDKPKTPKESKMKQLPGKIKANVSKAVAGGKQKLTNLKDKVNEKKSRKLIQKYGSLLMSAK